jgi:hypothetical protein
MLSEADKSSAVHASDLDKHSLIHSRIQIPLAFYVRARLKLSSPAFLETVELYGRAVDHRYAIVCAMTQLTGAQLRIRRWNVIVQVRNASGAAEILYGEHTTTYDALAWRQHL